VKCTTLNHLFGTYLDQTKEKPFIISEYVTKILTDRCKASFICQAYRSNLSCNPSFDGWIFEADFLFQLRMAELYRTPLQLGTIKHLTIHNGNVPSLKGFMMSRSSSTPTWNQVHGFFPSCGTRVVMMLSRSVRRNRSDSSR
jgi:hypothetical protein